MKSKLLLLLFAVSFSCVFAAGKEQPWKHADQVAAATPAISNVSLLSKKLTANLHTDPEKARAIYRWMTLHIAYDVDLYHMPDSVNTYSLIYQKLAPGKDLLRRYELAVAEYVLREKKGICDGYSKLFKVLCDSAGLKAAVITGVIKNNILQVGTALAPAHAWNAIYLDNKWQLLDVTWSAGYCDSAVRIFTRRFDDSYWLTSPSLLIYNHYPDDKKWFLCKAPEISVFYSYPLVYSGFFQSGIKSFYPANGAVAARPGEKVNIEFRIPADTPEIFVNTDHGNNKSKSREEKVLNCQYEISSDSDDRLTVFYKGSAIMSYRLFVVPGSGTK